MSFRSAKWRGVYLNQVKLTPIVQSPTYLFIPEESWLESIYENSVSIPLVRGKIVGRRLCVRVEYNESGIFTPQVSLGNLQMALNGVPPKPQGGRSDHKGFTFDFPIDVDDALPNEGNVTFEFQSENLQFEYRYEIK